MNSGTLFISEFPFDPVRHCHQTLTAMWAKKPAKEEPASAAAPPSAPSSSSGEPVPSSLAPSDPFPAGTLAPPLVDPVALATRHGSPVLPSVDEELEQMLQEEEEKPWVPAEVYQVTITVMRAVGFRKYN